jgi:O-antigen ligase
VFAILVLVGTAIGTAAFLLLAPGAYPEAKVLAILIFGYVSFQRLFAELNVGRPFFVGELGLAAAIAFVLARFAFQRKNPIPRDVLIVPIGLLFAFAAARIALVDWKQYGILAARDFATVYYSLFLLLGYTVAQHEKSLLLVRRALYFGILCYVPLILALKVISPQRGVTALLGGLLGGRDMAHIVPSAACLLCLLYSRYPKRRPYLVPLALLPLSLVLAGSARAAWVGLTIAGAIFMYAETPSGAQLVARFLTRAAVVAALFTALLVAGTVFDKAAAFTPSLAKLQAVFDIDALASSRTARMGTTDEYATETNRWRSAWWAAVWDDTMQKAPITGLGFGADLSDRFMREYYGGGISGVRNPHNIWFTFVGRTGLIGAGLFTAFVVLFFARVLKLAALARRRRIPITTLEFWLINVVILCVAFFSHTLEGPMAAIPFWTFLGIGIAQAQAALRGIEAPAPAAPRPAAPVRKRELVAAGAA